MKKILCIILVIVSTFVLVGCDNNDNNNNSKSGNGSDKKLGVNDSFENVANALCNVYNDENSTYEDFLKIMHTDTQEKVKEMISENDFYDTFKENIENCRWEPIEIKENEKEETIQCYEDIAKETFNANIELTECKNVILYDGDKSRDGAGFCKNKTDEKWHYYGEC